MPNIIRHATVLKRHKSVELKCAYFGYAGCVVSDFAHVYKKKGIIKVKYIPDTESFVLIPRKYNKAKLTTENLFNHVTFMCNDCSKCDDYREQVKQHVQKTQQEPQPNIQVSPYVTPHEEQKIQEVEKLPKIYCKMLQNKKQNER